LESNPPSSEAFVLAKQLGVILCEHGHDTRFAGGCVRDMLMGEKPKDYDLATTAPPDTVQRIFKTMNYTVLPTGLKHGTLTVIRHKIPFEITTLRRDVRCDGRRATVVFTQSFEEDALRRDFTVNALFQTMDGTIYDYVNGQNDIRNRKLIFVGSPQQRIREDALRILRYFRFIARFRWELNPGYEELFAREKHRMDILSRERIKSEFDEILTRDPDRVLPAMNRMGLFPHLFEGAEPPTPKNWPDFLFHQFPDDITHSGFRWFLLFNQLYSLPFQVIPAGQTARLSKKEMYLVKDLCAIIRRINSGLTGIPELLHALRGKSAHLTAMDFLTFFEWYREKHHFELPEVSQKILQSIDHAAVPAISSTLKRIHPPKDRKHFAFLFRISCYLNLCSAGEEVNFPLLNRKLKECGFDPHKELHDFPR
jgi:tRNA nucleotidyltransferase/poly(A) polymerase